MRKIVLLIILFCFTLAAAAQEKPLTQAEYVKLLYALPKSPDTKATLLAALRKRGIDFVLTDGLRGLTRTKSTNDEELKRALEEAERRRQDPVAAKLPSDAESNEILRLAASNTLAAVGDMPDFVVKQQIQRSAAYAGTNNFRDLDRLVVAVSYRSSGEENYRVLTLNGVLQNAPEAKRSYEQVGGTSSTGEFVTMLATIFKPESKTDFEIVATDIIRGRRTLVFEFSVDRDRAKQVISAVGYSTDTTISGMKGRLWIDREDARVLKVVSEATEIPANFPVRSAKRTIDYEWVAIEDEKYLLPSLSDVRLTLSDRSKLFETRNLIRFRDYQKYGTDVRILDEDVMPDETEKPD
jgi:hypothetical protein